MNEQYIGDRRDFVKYDLLLHLGRTLDLPGGLTVIPMLTSPRGRKSPPPYDMGARDSGLYTLLCSIASNLDLTYAQAAEKIATYFGHHDIPARFVLEGEFNSRNRSQYFSLVPQDSLADSIVFIDPDTGFEGTSRPNSTHLRYTEVEHIFANISDSSVLLVYQHKHQALSMLESVRKVLSELHPQTSIRHVAYVWDGDLALLVMTRGPEVLSRVQAAIEPYCAMVGCHYDIWDSSATEDLSPGGDRIADKVPARAPCLCGCGGYPKGKKSRYLPGHDARHAGHNRTS